MQTEIRRIHQRLGVTVIYVTHDQGEALTMSDRIAIMNEGRIEQVGSPADLYDRPNTKFVADFLGDTNFIAGKLIDVANEQGTIRTEDGWSFSGMLSDPSLKPGNPVVAGVRPEKIHVADAGETPTNTCTATIAEVVYSGDVTRYEVRAPGDVTLTVSAPNRANIARYQEGQSIPLAWDRSETRIFPA